MKSSLGGINGEINPKLRRDIISILTQEPIKDIRFRRQEVLNTKFNTGK